jgi:outer membrane protein assembly factor BamB
MTAKNGAVLTYICLALLSLALFAGCANQTESSPVKIGSDGNTEAGNQLLANSVSLSGEWVIEGYSPQRTRATVDTSYPPLTMNQEYMVGGETRYGSPVGIARNLVYMEGERKLHALTMDQGIETWAYELPGSFVSPTIAGGTVFVRAESGDEGYVVALTAESGLKEWQFKFPAVGSSEGNLGGHVTSPVVADGLVLVGAGRSLLALDASTGRQVWAFNTNEPISSSATVADKIVYFVDFETLYAVDLQTGAEQWQFPQEALSVIFAPVVTGDTIVTADGDTVHLLDRHTGQMIWRKQIENTRLVPAGAAGDQIYVKSTNTLYALDPVTGDEVWSFHTTDFISLPAITSEVIYIVTRAGGTGQLRAVSLTSGEEVWQTENARFSNAAPIVARGQVFVRTVDGSLLVFGGS